MNLANIPPEQKKKLLTLLKKDEHRYKYGGHLAKYFPEGTELSIEKYPRHKEFFDAGLFARERLFMAANRAGKTVAGAYEVTCHLTGKYPDWWTGRRFDRPVNIWAAGKSLSDTRDVIQHELFGSPERGTGMIPAEDIIKIVSKPGVPGGIDWAEIQHVSGGTSSLGLKSYEQGRESFQGTAKECIWLDEEPSYEVYGETLIRTMTTGGIVLVTFTPVNGLTKFVTEFMADADSETVGETVV